MDDPPPHTPPTLSTLPIEILTRILTELFPYPTLHLPSPILFPISVPPTDPESINRSQLCLVNSTWCQILRPLIFRQLKFTFKGDGTALGRRLEALRVEGLGEFTRSSWISVNGMEGGMASELFEIMPNLELITINDKNGRLLDPSQGSSAIQSLSLKPLKDFNYFPLSIPSLVSEFDPDYLSILFSECSSTLRRISILTYQTINVLEDPGHTLRWPIRPEHRFPTNLTRLIIRTCIISVLTPYMSRLVLSSSETLQSLTLDYLTIPISLRPGSLINLRNLAINGTPDAVEALLSACTDRLRTVEMNVVPRITPTILSLIPESIQVLSFLPGTFFNKNLAGLVETLARLENLKTLQMKYAHRIGQIEAFARLGDRCRERGIDLSV